MTGARRQVDSWPRGNVRPAALAVLVAAVALGLWTASSCWVAPSQAAPASEGGGIPDAGAQRLALIQGMDALAKRLDTVNQKLDRVISLMETGVKVTLVEPGAEKPGNAPKPK